MLLKTKWVAPIKASQARLPEDYDLSILAQTGSRAYGTNRPDSDYDYRGVYVAPMSAYGSLAEPKKTIDISDPDITLYELKHFCKLAAAANPSILEVLWCGQRQTTPVGDLLIANRKLFLSKRIAASFGGYAKDQLQRAQNGTGGSRGQNQYKRTKFKLHTLRLVNAGFTALTTGEVPVKVKDPEWLWTMAAKPVEDVQVYVDTKLRQMDAALARTELPDVPDYEVINQLMIEIREEVSA